MRNKIIVISIVVFMLLVTFVSGSQSLAGTKKDDRETIEKNENKCSKNEKEFCTHLPLVSIDTNNQDIPGEAKDGSTIKTNIRIIDNKKGGNHLGDKAKVKTLANIRYRGNSSIDFDKKGYLLKFINKDDTDNKEKVMGMDKHSEWVLHGPYLDKTLLRNYLWYHISNQIMDSAPDSRFCELFVDGKYMGVYVMVESPSRGDKSRMQINKYDGKSDYTSYIVRYDRISKNAEDNLNNFTRYTYNTSNILSALDVVYPGKEKINDKLKRYITIDINKFEKALYSYDYNSKKHGYRNYINVNSFVDYFIINEFTQNNDAGRYSTYLYKDVGGKLSLYVWDFNNANNLYEEETSLESFQMQGKTWYHMLMKDQDFTDEIIKRYKYLRKNYLNEEYLLNYIDEITEYLGDAIERNYSVWGYTFDRQDEFFLDNGRDAENYDEALTELKHHIINRGRFLDKNIETIKQFSAESKVKKYNH